MEQRSDVQYRAEKLYKNSREKFWYLIREVVSNAIHAVIIRKKTINKEDFIPTIKLNIEYSDKSVKLILSDNGDGFTESNRKYFTHLDSRNPEKERLHLHPKGQGRLAIVFFSDNATYTSIYVEPSFGVIQKRIFDYPKSDTPLFDVDDCEVYPTDETEVGTILEINIVKQQTYGRAKTFFSKYSTVELLQGWFIEHFFPFFMEDDKLELTIIYNDELRAINRGTIENDVKQVPFNMLFADPELGLQSFILWMIEKVDKPKTKNTISCYARHLKAELTGTKLEYDIELPNAYDWLLTSEYFDDIVDEKGDKLEINNEDSEQIQNSLHIALDEYFSEQIQASRKLTKENIQKARAKYHSLSTFIDSDKSTETRCVLSESEIIGRAIEAKGRVEKSYWSSQKIDNTEASKLINSSLHIYIDHRSKILKKFHELILRYDDSGNKKREPEDEIHDLFLRRGTNLSTSQDINHLHNLWILDDKYTIFTESFKTSSSRKGQEASDIYVWADDPEKTRELLILELKATSSAHNAGDKYESMTAQIKRYAAQFYKDPMKVLNWDVNPDGILYSGIILARKCDVHKEINSNNSLTPTKIPYLESSYYYNNEKFTIGTDAMAAPSFRDIRIEMYSFEDIYKLALARNTVFFNLLKGEFNVDRTSEQGAETPCVS